MLISKLALLPAHVERLVIWQSKVVSPRTSTKGVIHWLDASHSASALPWYGDPIGLPMRSDVMIGTHPQVVE